MNSRFGPHDLRASDADRELVIALLSEAAGDGRLTLAEHAERSERALGARTLGELAGLTSDLVQPSGQPIKLYSGRAVTALFSKERREGRWVVPDSFAVTAICGDVVLDLRDALMQSQRVIIYATAIGGQIRLIVPAGIAVEMVGRSFLGIRSVSRRGRLRGVPGGRPPESAQRGVQRGRSPRSAPRAVPGGRGTGLTPRLAAPSAQGVIEVRTLALGGMVKAVTPRTSRWSRLVRRRASRPDRG